MNTSNDFWSRDDSEEIYDRAKLENDIISQIFQALESSNYEVSSDFNMSDFKKRVVFTIWDMSDFALNDETLSEKTVQQLAQKFKLLSLSNKDLWALIRKSI